MFRKYMIFILAAFMIVGTSACTSKGSTDDATIDSGGDGLETADAVDNGDGLSTDDSGAVADLGGINDDLAPDEKLPDDKAGGDALADAGAPPADPGAMADVPPPVGDEMATATEPAPPPEPGGMENKEAAMAEPPPPAEPMAPPVPEPVAEAKPVATLQKVKTTPWKQGKTLANAIYIARQGDSPETISQKVYGTKDKVKELCKVNSHNCSRSTKVGDKFYYNSPQRPTDDTTVKTFYEDAGIAPQVYTAVEGDNIRKVSKTLLGDDNSWKEVWATNDVESKQGLDAGTQLKYWPDAPAAPAVAQTEDPGAAAPPPDQAAAEPPPPMPDQAAAPPPPPPPPAELPPAPPQDQPPAAAMTAPPEPPQQAPPPPPPPVEQAANHSAPAGLDAGGQDPNQTMALGVGAVLLLAAAALFISIRKKRARRQIDFNTTTQTQIE